MKFLLMEQYKSKQKNNMNITFFALAIMANLLLQHIQLSYSVSVPINKALTFDIQWLMISMLFLVFLFFLNAFLFKKAYLVMTISTLIISLWSITNYYVVKFHGSPLFAGEILPTFTAARVITGYRLSIDNIIIRIVILGIVQLLIVTGIAVFSRKEVIKLNRLFTGGILVCLASLFYILMIGSNPLINKNLISWSWYNAVANYGYEPCLLNSFYVLNSAIVEPDNYNSESIVTSGITKSTYTRTLDIILILNESFFDLQEYLGLSESVFDFDQNTLNVFQGKTVVSGCGGATNNSEYELLTSNSMQLLSVAAPFTYLDLNGANSIVSYLAQLGYSTAGMHCADGNNYNRNNAYKALGFEKIYLGKEKFQSYNSYGNRKWLDSDNYKDLITEYEKMGDTPRFAYLLTFQNHGGYEQNPDEDDTIHVEDAYGELTDDINEYLSSIQLSINAYYDLIKYFQESEREVIVCMVGDHAPSFITELTPKSNVGSLEIDIARRSVPYFVWSNFDIEGLSDLCTITDIIPLILRSASIELSEYYNEICNLSDIIPVRTSYGTYIDSNGNSGNIDAKMQNYPSVHNYLMMEFNNLNCKESDYRCNLFLPAG